MYSIERQKLANEGPVPEGEYWISVDEQRAFPKSPLSHGLRRTAWGRYSWSLHPEVDTVTYGRGGFFIHGGDRWGSNGCIDIKKGDLVLMQFLDGLCGCYIPVTIRYLSSESIISEKEQTWYYR